MKSFRHSTPKLQTGQEIHGSDIRANRFTKQRLNTTKDG